MKISIITVNLNNKTGLENTMRSVFQQTYTDFEYIVVDGASIDGSVDIIQQNAGRLTNWISEPDSGIYNAMNKGIRMAKGRYLLFLNSGDTLFHNRILEQVFPHLQEQSIIYGDLRFDFVDRPEDYVYPDRLTFHYFYYQSLGHPATFIKKSLFDQIGLYDEEYPICADWVFFTTAICTFKASYLHLPLLITKFDMTGVSNNPVSQEKIKKEKIRFLSQHFERFYSDYQEAERSINELARIKSSKAYRWLRVLGIKKFR